MSQDIVERLRCFGYGTTNPEVCKEAADTIESLRTRVAELESENSSLNDACFVENQAATNYANQVAHWIAKHDTSREQLAAQAVTIKTMREALEYASIGSCSCVTKTPDTEFHSTLCKYRIIQKALAIPDNSTEVLDKYTKPLNDQLAAQALTIKTMREALDASPSGIHQLPGGDCSCSQCEFVRLRKRALALPDNSTEVLQDWLDKQLGEPVAWVNPNNGVAISAVKKLIDRDGVFSISAYRKPAIK